MMAAWVTCYRVPPPHNRTIMVRFGSSIFFAAFSKWTGWKMIANGSEEDISAPSLWYCTDEAAAQSEAEEARVIAEHPQVSLRRSKRPLQLALAFDDSVSQSQLRRSA